MKVLNMLSNLIKVNRRGQKASQKDVDDKNDIFDSKDKLTIFRNKIDKGAVDEQYRKEVYKEKADLSKSLGGVSKTFKKKKRRNDNKRRKIADEDDNDDY